MMKKVYICAPLGGDVKGNLEKVKRYTRFALMCGTAPVVPHFYALCLDDDIEKEREIGIVLSVVILVYVQFFVPAVVTLCYAFLTIRMDDTSPIS